MQIKKIFILIGSLFIITTLSMLVCYADNDIAVTQAYVDANYIDVFMPISMNSDALSLKISNQNTILIDSGSIAGKDISVYTTILLDISTSTPLETRDKVIEFINHLIKNIAPNEKYKIVTFGEELTVLQDFTSDRYELSNSIDKIEFNAKQSMIYDAIYNTIPIIQPLGEETCFYRTIVITDGVDVTSSGITKEELYLKLKSDTYPIDVVDVCKTEQTSSKKELAALTRISNGRYNKIYSETDNSELTDAIDTGSIFWCRAEIPESLLDGSTRQVNISDESNNIQFDIKVSVYNTPVTDTSFTTHEETNNITSLTELNAEFEKTDLTPALFGNYTFVIFAVLGIVIIILLIAIILIIKKSSTRSKETVKSNPIVQNVYDEKTELVKCSNTQFIIKISNVKKPSDYWTLPLDSELIIGRSEHNAIRLSDKSVSREQCKIIVQGENLAVVNLSGTNKTILNGVNILESSVLQAGDILKLGREELHIDYIQSLSETPSYNNQNGLLEGSDTESIF